MNLGILNFFKTYYKIGCLFISCGKEVCKILWVNIILFTCLVYISFRIRTYKVWSGGSLWVFFVLGYQL
jgi:hypothetical protein